MRKAILVTKEASENILSRYLDCEIIGLDEGIDVARSVGAKITLAVSSFENVSLQHVLSFLPKDKVVKYIDDNKEAPYLKVCNFLFSQGYEEIIILGDFLSRFDRIHGILLTLKNAKGFVSFQNEENLVSYYSKGSHIINKQDYSSLYVIGFPYAVISMEHVEKPIKNMKLDFTTDKALENSILERVAVLKVNEGGVLLALCKDE